LSTPPKALPGPAFGWAGRLNGWFAPGGELPVEGRVMFGDWVGGLYEGLGADGAATFWVGRWPGMPELTTPVEAPLP